VEDKDRRQAERRDGGRAPAIRELSQSYARVGAALSDVGTGIDYLAGLLKTLVIVVVIACLLLLVPAGYNVWNGYRGSRARDTLLRQTADIERVSKEVHSAVTPGQPIYQQGQQVQAGALAELDCRDRRALAHMPMPDPAKGRCVDQTPIAVLNG
jgi:hypothetical protein